MALKGYPRPLRAQASAVRPVFWYVHHHGSGHWRRALAVTAALDCPIVLASSAPPPARLPRHARFVPLAMDAPASPVQQRGATAGGRLHWAPAGHSGLLRRNRQLLEAAHHYNVGLAVVDVSAEVAVLLRGSGIPVVAVRLPGQRDDPAHDLGFGISDQIVIPVPAAWGLHTPLARTTATGLISALGDSMDTTGRPGPPQRAGAADVVAVLIGTGGSRLDREECCRIARDLPSSNVVVAGDFGPAAIDRHRAPAPREAGHPPNLRLAGRVQDVLTVLRGASVVIGNAGLGTVADVAVAQRPLVVLPEERPFGEQAATARALHRSGAAVVLDDLPAAGGWRDAVTAAAEIGPPGVDVGGAARFAAIVSQAVRGRFATDPPVLTGAAG